MWQQALERLSNPEVLFGLAVRFFGVFAVLIILMIALRVFGFLFIRLQKGPQEDSPVGGQGTPAPEPHPPEAPAEAAVRSMPEILVPDEVAAAIALALSQTIEARVALPSPSHPPTAPTAREEPGSAWKFVGRQEGLFRRTSLTRPTTSRDK